MPARHRVTTLTIAGGSLVLALLAGCTSGDQQHDTDSTPSAAAQQSERRDESGRTVTVEVSDMSFAPNELTISVGDTVTWEIADSVPHGVQGIGDKAMGINSPIEENGEWSHTFTSPGTYRYLCPLHPQMRGTIEVE